MNPNVISGKAWVGGDDIFATDIIPQKHWGLDNLDPEALGPWAMEGVDPDFLGTENGFRYAGYTFVVAGRNFGGGGKSIEHPVLALINAGVKAVLADSFARYNFRNSINNGLPVFTCEGISQMVRKGDVLELDFEKGEVTNITSGTKRTFTPLPEFVQEIMNGGGLLEYTKKQLREKGLAD